MANQIDNCRIGGKGPLLTVLDLGQQALTGIFPKSRDQSVTVGPLELVWDADSLLLQLKHSFSAEEMYGDNYGYRSGLNESMVKHLHHKVVALERLRPLASNEIVLDIGSNDGTLLKGYTSKKIRRIGVDPTGSKFRSFYTERLELVTDFFPSPLINEILGSKKCAIITSIAMFYDLEKPIEFATQIASILADDGIWHFEQSYMPSMLRTNAYDTVCHEHLEYYCLHTVRDIMTKAGLKIIDVQMNNTNGGSFAVTAGLAAGPYHTDCRVVPWMLQQEERMGLRTPRPYREFEARVFEHRANLKALIEAIKADGSTIAGYGASTKGNVLLQFCGIGPNLISCIGDVNSDKYGCITPGTHIPIVSESEMHAMKPDYILVLPWHFRDHIIRREENYLAHGGKMIFPLPEIEIVGG
jgi:hypothetical protein